MNNLRVEYVWLDGDSPQKLRSKTKIITIPEFENPNSLDIIVSGHAIDLPNWNYDGSSTNQATTDNSEIILIPKTRFRDPFYENGILVMCETQLPDGTPTETNFRSKLEETVKQKDQESWYGFEQEYVMINGQTGRPIGFPTNTRHKPEAQGNYYCGVGADYVLGRDIAFQHLDYCLKAGINISGVNAEVLLGQWEYQVGPVNALEGSDQLWMSRYILYRLGEIHDIEMNIDPKPLEGTEWNGSGMHVNFSTGFMRDKDNIKSGRSMKAIIESCEKLSKKHPEHISVYGEGNEKRLTGENETANINEFKWGVGDRTASIRIPYAVKELKQGYLEDRRPASNADPYIVCRKLIETIC